MSPKSEVGRDRVGIVGIIAVSVFLLTLTVGLMYTLLTFWPSNATQTQASDGVDPIRQVQMLWWNFPVQRDLSLFAIVLAAGAIGGTIHSVRSLYWFVGNRTLRHSWILMYCSLPLMGAALALIAYLAVRGGLTTALSSSADISPFGVAAVAALVGMFSRETAEKLRAVFATLLTPAEKGKDPANPGMISRIQPSEGPVGSTVTILGSGFTDAKGVKFGASAAVSPQILSDTRMTTVVPAGPTGPAIIKVTTPSGDVEGPDEFTVTPGN